MERTVHLLTSLPLPYDYRSRYASSSDLDSDLVKLNLEGDVLLHGLKVSCAGIRGVAHADMAELE